MDNKALARSAARRLIYQRNKKIVKEFKEGMVCSVCHDRFPSYMLDFTEPSDGTESVAMCIINRASEKRLRNALSTSKLMCLNHLAEYKNAPK